VQSKINRVVMAVHQADSRRILGEILEAEGLEVCRASDAASALALATQDATLAILSVDLPGLPPNALCEELRQRVGPAVWILIELDRREERRAEELIRAGADELIERGGSTSLLRERIRQALRTVRQRHALEQRIERLEEAQRAFGLQTWEISSDRAESLGPDLLLQALQIERVSAAKAVAIHPEDQQRLWTAFGSSRRDGSPFDVCLRCDSGKHGIGTILCRGEWSWDPAGDTVLHGTTMHFANPRGVALVAPNAPNAPNAGSREVTAAADSAFLARLSQAVEEEAFLMYYQPKVAADDGAISGCEALIRWRDGSEWISPATFVPTLEAEGLIGSVGLWSLRAVCDQLAAWQRTGLAPGHAAVNVSPLQFRDPALGDHVLEAVERSGIVAGTLQVEITEGCLIDNLDQVVRTLERLREHSIGISIDDFGTGFSSLQYLARLPIDCLKIDRSFVEPLEHDGEARSLVMAIIAMAWNLGLRVVAEGVETQAQREFLIDHGCDEIQGYAISPPLPSQEFEALLRREGAD